MKIELSGGLLFAMLIYGAAGYFCAKYATSSEPWVTNVVVVVLMLMAQSYGYWKGLTREDERTRQ